ncbi:mechanosensitive ion channel domain-containing protein [Ferrimonas marina]|uniref:Potassium efflux system protein n=1 Tax=Ferrimonas marina TaxID=299255 RepID=A0A1M5X9V8_9GAMM|nr:mechanosensitive ion channel domain-containing protein [Ferrimonas marina]SHH96637.1 potassium efflux system protein [Ferrimonas marina]
MWRLLCSLLLLASTLAQANSPFSMERRLTPFGSNNPQSVTLEQWTSQQRLLDQQAEEYQELLEQFVARQAQLKEQLRQPLSSEVDSEQPVSQQQSWVHLQLQELKTSAESLASLHSQTRQRLNQLPDAEQQASVQLRLARNESGSAPQVAARQLYYQSLVNTLQLEQQALPLQLQLIQLRQRLVQNQLAALELRLNRLNDSAAQARRNQSEAALSDNPVGPMQDPSLSALSEVNADLARALALLNQRMEQTSRDLVSAEQQYQAQAAELRETQEQLEWGSVSADFGESLIRRLKSLQLHDGGQATSQLLTQSRLQRYDYDHQRDETERKIRDGDADLPHQPLWQRQVELLSLLIDTHEQWVVELSRLKLQQEQLDKQSERFVRLITEYLFWLPNARRIGAETFSNLGLGLSWLTSPLRWQELQQSYQNNINYWGGWLALLVLILASWDLLKGPYARAREHYSRFVGNVTQDKFSASFKVLLMAMAVSLLLPAPFWVAGSILRFGEGPLFAQAVGQGLLAIALVLQLYWLIYHLSHEDGLMVAHFRRNAPLMAHVRRVLGKLHLIAAPLLALVAFTQYLDMALLSNSLGRLAFILLCLLLAYAYRRLSRFAGQYHKHHSRENINRRFIERLIWLVLIVLPLVCLVLAWRGYYYSAQQLLGQAQITVTLGIMFLLAYLLVKRWMLIERRKLQFELAKAKRAEVLAQREKERSEGISNTSAEGQLDTLDEPTLDLDTISTQSLGLVRSLMILAFALSLLALWSQTHPAMFSFLEGITLYSSSQLVDGVEQAVPITLMSLVAALMIGVFTWMIARNLPGLLELLLLQRLELTPGTGFAISTVSKYVVFMIGVFATFSTLGLAWSKMQWLIAALTVGLGFGLQEIFANFISGLIILFEKPIRIGDTVTIRELTGTVSKIQIRATTIVDWDRKEIIVPNKAFITEQLVNWSLSDAITRVILTVSVARDSDPALVEAVLHQAVQECPLALAQPEPEIFFAGFGAHTQDFEVRAYADEMGKRWPLRHDLHMRITSKFRDKGIVLAYPQMDLHLNTNDAKESGLIR